jgi:hypothetical protein
MAVFNIFRFALIFLIPALLSAQVSIVSSSYTAITTSTTSFTYNLPGGGGSERMLLVLISAEFNNTSNDIVDVSYGDQSLTEIVKTNISGAGKNNLVAAYRLLETEINAATSDLLVITPSSSYTGSSNLESMVAAVFLLGNVNQSNATEDSKSNTSASATSISTGNINADTDDLIVYLTNSSGSTSTWTPGSGFTERMDVAADNHSFEVATQLRPNNGVSSPSATNSGTNRLAIIAFEVNEGTVPLPIKLNFFDAVAEGNSVRLNWQSATEVNNDYYTIEHATDAVNWQEVLRVTGAGNSQQPVNYNAYHDAPAQGMNYYRLKQTDFDGRYEYFYPVAVNMNSNFNATASAIALLPNPSTDMAYVYSNEPFTQLVVYASDGSQVLTYTPQSPTNDYLLPVTNLPQGIYRVSVVTSAAVKTSNLLVGDAR